jgi:hypothetical protein
VHCPTSKRDLAKHTLFKEKMRWNANSDKGGKTSSSKLKREQRKLANAS